jgi:Ran GTPase-activating protein (RanGAP) involved in mRNA processing and transport
MSDKETTTGHENVLELIAALKNESNWDLNAQKLTNEYIRALAKELQSNTNCGVLHLHLNSITDDSVSCLAEMLKVNQTLTDLYLGANVIGDQGVEVLCQALTHYNRTIKVVDLTYNQITDKSVNMILDMFKVNGKLMGFMLVGNIISEESKDKLCEVAEVRNISLGVNF